MINDFLVISCTGKNNLIGLKTNNKFFKEKLQNNINSNNMLVSNILSFTNKHEVKLNNKYSIIVNMGPGSFSTLRISLSVAKGIQIVHGSKLYGFKSDQLSDLSLENIENLIKNEKLENKMINPIYK
jgi:tRNA A37 threonylcarbamoyladenosine modification protein TsaB|tara:strand:+ start:206 stop:586 length:381 start_codon:yes stop_codon:yes gene_type:complete